MANDITITDRFVLFWDGWPSQFFKRPFEVDGVRYVCCEQYMMARKADVFGDAEILEKILKAGSPREHKALGRQVRGFDPQVWNGVCRGIVYLGNLAKYSQNADLGRQLMDTGTRTIVEASPEDRIWGIGLAQDDPRAQEPGQWEGTNWLGIALMQVRQTLADRAAGRPATAEPELQKQLDALSAMTRRGQAKLAGAAAPPPADGNGGVDALLARHGGLSYLEIPAIDIRRSADFYANVLGWRVEHGADGRTKFSDPSGHLIGRWIPGRKVARSSRLSPYFYVNGIDEAVASAVAHGGEIVKAPTAEGNLRIAAVRDPAGNFIGLWQAAGR